METEQAMLHIFRKHCTEGNTELVLSMLNQAKSSATVTKLLVDQESSSFPPLCKAAEMGHNDIVTLLLKAEGDVGARTVQSGETALHLAARNGFVALTQLLKDFGADPYVQDCNCWTPLFHAAVSDRQGCVELLLQWVDVNFTNTQGKTVLEEVVRKGCASMTRILLEAGADASTQTTYGWSLLHLAAKAGFLEVAQLLVEHSAYLEAVDLLGQTPLSLAEQNCREDVVQFLASKQKQSSNKVQSPSQISCLKEDLSSSTKKEPMNAAEVLQKEKLESEIAKLQKKEKEGKKELDTVILQLYKAKQKEHELQGTIQAQGRQAELKEKHLHDQINLILEQSQSQINEMQKQIKEQQLELENKERALQAKQQELEEKCEEIRKKIQDEHSGHECCICLRNPRCLVLLPCKHFCVCTSCGQRPEVNRCPICRVRIQNKLEVFL